MTTYRESSAQNTAGNPLCDRLQREFRGRGVHSARVHRESTAVMLDRVRRGVDPYEGAPDPAKRTVSVCSDRTQKTKRSTAAPNVSAAPKARASAPVQSTTKAVARPRTVESKAISDEVRRKRSATAAAKRAGERVKPEEMRIRQPFPFAALSLLSVFTVMFMVILFSFAQNYELSREISALEDRSRDLNKTAQEMAIQLEERDDVRVIENIAVNELGMVKNDLVESRFVSVAGSDRIELTAAAENTEGDTAPGIFSTMLSAIGENFDRLMDYIE